jgi:hypothetical protein
MNVLGTHLTAEQMGDIRLKPNKLPVSRTDSWNFEHLFGFELLLTFTVGMHDNLLRSAIDHDCQDPGHFNPFGYSGAYLPI